MNEATAYCPACKRPIGKVRYFSRGKVWCDETCCASYDASHSLSGETAKIEATALAQAYAAAPVIQLQFAIGNE